MSHCRSNWSWVQCLGLLFLLASAVRSQQLCRGLDRDLRFCRARSLEEERECVAEQNTMLHLMDCVKQDHNEIDESWCRSRYPGDEKFDALETPGTASDEKCLAPREVLLQRSTNRCGTCLLTGALISCPKNDPRFLSCLCEQGARLHHLQCLATCFKDDPKMGKKAASLCPDLRKRDELIDAESNIITTKVVERQAQPTHYLPLSHYYRVTNDKDQTALVVCTVDSMNPAKSCSYVKTQAAVPTDYILPSEPTRPNYKSKVTESAGRYIW